jgi:hypothetical protein
LRVLFVNPRPCLPQLLGGVETTTFDLVQQLLKFGHEAAVMCQIRKYDRLWLRNRLTSRLLRRPLSKDQPAVGRCMVGKGGNRNSEGGAKMAQRDY